MALGITISASELDPFMHRDISLALKEVIQLADEDELDDIEVSASRPLKAGARESYVSVL